MAGQVFLSARLIALTKRYVPLWEFIRSVAKCCSIAISPRDGSPSGAPPISWTVAVRRGESALASIWAATGIDEGRTAVVQRLTVLRADGALFMQQFQSHEKTAPPLAPRSKAHSH